MRSLDDGREVSIEEIVRSMKDRGLRVTPQRVMIAKLIIENVAEHPSLKELHERAKSVLPGVGISTVYNTIVMLESMNLVRTFYVEGRLHVDDNKPHLNVYCKDTQKILDVDGSVSEKVLSVLRESGIRVESPTIVVMGYCGHDGLQ